MIRLLSQWLRRRQPAVKLYPDVADVDADVTAVIEEDTAPSEPTLAILLKGQGLSARLETMLSTTKLGTMTATDYAQDPDSAIAWMLQQQNCGRKTANELATLLEALPLPDLPTPEDTPDPPLLDISLGEMLSADRVSARLGEVLLTTKLGATRLADYVRDRYPLERWMMQLPNCGRRSVTELRGLVGMHVRDMLEAQDLNADDFGSEFASFVASAPAREPDMGGPPPGCDLQALLEWHLGRLPKRTSEVIGRRFGLLDGRSMTLAEIGERHGVTRERIRQVEAKGLKAMRAACLRFPIRPLVDDATPRLLGTILDGALHTTSNQANRELARMDGWHELAILLAHEGAPNWLATSARRFGDGWLAPMVDPAAVEEAAARLRSRATGGQFPRATDALCDGVDPALATAAMELVLGWHVEAGYAFARRPGPRLRRTARLHSLLTATGEPLEIVLLLSRYHEIARHDRCSDRDLVIVMEASPHLFLEIHEGCWTAIGHGAPPWTPKASANTAPDDASVVEEGTNATALERELERVGPCRMGELMNRAIDILPEGRSRHSVGPTLLCNPSRFVRVLPGVYALPHQVLDGRDLIHAGAVDYLLNTTQARFYAVGRKAGERWGAYPLWTPTAEMRLCRWARAGDDRPLYRSLLDVASIEDWPTNDADREAWRELQSRDGRYELWTERRSAGTRPPIDRVLAAAVRLAGTGSIGWVAANRILGYGPSSCAGSGLLAGLVSAGMALEKDGEFAWQLPYLPGPRLTEWLESLAAELHDIGAIDWTKGVGAELARVFSPDLGDGDVPPEEPEEMDEYELIMAEHRQSMQARRLEAQLELQTDE